MSGMIVHDFLPGYGEFVESVPVGDGIEAVFYDDGAVRIAHDCKMVGEDRRLRTAPLLQLGNGHTIVVREAQHLTIVASILCGDCGLHGFITDGRWIGC